MKDFKLTEIAEVKAYAGDIVKINVGKNMRGAIMFTTIIDNPNPKRKRFGTSFLGFEELLRRYPSLKPRQKELYDKITLALYGEKEQ